MSLDNDGPKAKVHKEGGSSKIIAISKAGKSYSLSYIGVIKPKAAKKKKKVNLSELEINIPDGKMDIPLGPLSKDSVISKVSSHPATMENYSVSKSNKVGMNVQSQLNATSVETSAKTTKKKERGGTGSKSEKSSLSYDTTAKSGKAHFSYASAKSGKGTFSYISATEAEGGAFSYSTISKSAKGGTNIGAGPDQIESADLDTTAAVDQAAGHFDEDLINVENSGLSKSGKSSSSASLASGDVPEPVKAVEHYDNFDEAITSSKAAKPMKRKRRGPVSTHERPGSDPETRVGAKYTGSIKRGRTFSLSEYRQRSGELDPRFHPPHAKEASASSTVRLSRILLFSIAILGSIFF